jgi:hypothetical protein
MLRLTPWLQEAIVAVALVGASAVASSILNEPRIALVGGLLVGLRLGWLRSPASVAAFGVTIALSASWVGILPMYVPWSPLGILSATIVVVGFASIGLLVGRLVRLGVKHLQGMVSSSGLSRGSK